MSTVDLRTRAYTADRIFDGEKFLEDYALIIEDDAISSVIPRADLLPAIPVQHYPDCTLIPGLIDSKTNYVEHPRLVSMKLKEWVQVIGSPERVMGGVDCGFATIAGASEVDWDIGWVKLRALHDGARLASAELGLIDPNSRV